MRAVRELEVWSPPGQLLPSEFAKQVLQLEVWNAGVPRDVFLGISEMPDQIDSRNLRSAIDRGEVDESEFKEFCKLNGLAVGVDSIESASKYLEYLHGRCLAWVHLPEGPDQARLLMKIKDLMSQRGYRIVDPEY
jgi:hypothetical protein